MGRQPNIHNIFHLSDLSNMMVWNRDVHTPTQSCWSYNNYIATKRHKLILAHVFTNMSPRHEARDNGYRNSHLNDFGYTYKSDFFKNVFWRGIVRISNWYYSCFNISLPRHLTLWDKSLPNLGGQCTNKDQYHYNLTMINISTH